MEDITKKVGGLTLAHTHASARTPTHAHTSKDKYHYYDPLYVPGAFGFRNTAAICWGNSLIQNMLGVSSLNKLLLERENDLADNAFATEYIKLLKLVLPNTLSGNGEVESKTDLINPNDLEMYSSRILTAMIQRMHLKGFKLNMGMGEECADEAFTMFIDMLGLPAAERLFTNIYSMTIECSNCHEVVSSVRDRSFRVEMFTGTRIETQELFNNWIKCHLTRHDHYTCDKCKYKMVNFDRVERIKMLSEVIVILFNKFQEKTKRWFPQSLRFKAISGPDLEYKLIGKIEHSGNMRGGHYWAHSVRDGTWTYLNDNATPSTGSADPTPNTFMIMYHMVTPTAS